jgi:hypothetical protein
MTIQPKNFDEFFTYAEYRWSFQVVRGDLGFSQIITNKSYERSKNECAMPILRHKINNKNKFTNQFINLRTITKTTSMLLTVHTSEP